MIRGFGRIPGMPNTTLSPAYRFRRIDATRNMERFYMLSLEPTLFGEVAVLRHWGRIGTRGRQVSSLHASLAEAETVLARQIARRRRRGYTEA